MADCLSVTFYSLFLLLIGTSKYYFSSNFQEISCGMYVDRIFQMLTKTSLSVSLNLNTQLTGSSQEATDLIVPTPALIPHMLNTQYVTGL